MSNADLLKDSPLYPILVEEAKRDERRATIRLVLEGRLGKLSDDVVEALKAADEATLTTIAVHAGTDTLEQIRSRLGLSETQG